MRAPATGKMGALGTKARKGGRVVDCTGLENRQGESLRGFESHPFRQQSSNVRQLRCPDGVVRASVPFLLREGVVLGYAALQRPLNPSNAPPALQNAPVSSRVITAQPPVAQAFVSWVAVDCPVGDNRVAVDCPAGDSRACLAVAPLRAAAAGRR